MNIILGFIGVTIVFLAGFGAGVEAGRVVERQGAIKAGAAEYISNKETGNPEFRYLTK